MQNRSRIYTHDYASPIGNLRLAVDKFGHVMSIGLGEKPVWGSQCIVEENKYACGELEYQLDRYFTGALRDFSLELRLNGTAFQRAVWSRLLKVEYGATITYGELAHKIGRHGAARAVGNAVASNPIPLLVPCHRVLPATGRIGNYALRSLTDGSGASRKRWLLELEGALPRQASIFSRISA